MTRLFCILVVLCLMTGCNSNQDLGEITVVSVPIKKRQYKTHEQFIQIAYIDLFNKTIEPQRLSGAKHIFDSQGDDDLSYKLFIRELVSEASARLPSDSVIRKGPETFVVQSYLKFFGRYPNGYEKKILIEDINKDTTISAGKIYYILMTTEEYRMF